MELGLIPKIQIQLDDMKRDYMNPKIPKGWIMFDPDPIRMPTQKEIDARCLGALTAIAHFEAWLGKAVQVDPSLPENNN